MDRCHKQREPSFVESPPEKLLVKGKIWIHNGLNDDTSTYYDQNNHAHEIKEINQHL